MKRVKKTALQQKNHFSSLIPFPNIACYYCTTSPVHFSEGREKTAEDFCRFPVESTSERERGEEGEGVFSLSLSPEAVCSMTRNSVHQDKRGFSDYWRSGVQITHCYGVLKRGGVEEIRTDMLGNIRQRESAIH